MSAALYPLDMSFSLIGRTLPARISAYRGTVEGVDGYVCSIDGRVAFINDEQAAAFGEYLRLGKSADTQPIEVRQPLAPQARTGG